MIHLRSVPALYGDPGRHPVPRLVLVTPPGRRPREADAFEWLSLPIRYAQLLRCLDSHRQTSDGGQAVGRRAAAAAPAAVAAAPAAVAAAPPLCCGRVLVADDNLVNRRVARRILEKDGLVVDTVNNGREAVEAHLHTHYDAIFMDCQMPVMDGYEATAMIRWGEKEGDRHVPIIAMTANAMPGDREKCLSAGMDSYLSKPIRPSELRAILKNIAGSGG